MLKTTRELLASKRAAAAVIVALATPALLGAAGFGVEAGLLNVKRAQLQNAADAAAAAGREKLDPSMFGYQSMPVDEAVSFGNQNMSSSVKAEDVELVWWNSLDGKAQDPIANGFDSGFANAVRVTARMTQPLVFGKLLGIPAVALHSRPAIAYKCSNINEPETNVDDDPNATPDKPAMYASFAAEGNGPDTSYYFQDGPARRPVFKFYSPYDYEVSWTIRFDNGNKLEVETYCRGTTLIVPAGFDLNVDGRYGHAYIQRGLIKKGGVIDSFDADPDQVKNPVAFNDSIFYDDNVHELPLTLPQGKVHATRFPAFVSPGYQFWFSNGLNTPNRQSVLVQ